MEKDMCISEKQFNNFVEEFKTFKNDISVEINKIPNKVLNTQIEVNNGNKHSISVKDALTQNWERTYNLSKGDISLTLEDSDGYKQTWGLAEILKKLNQRPIATFNKVGKFSENATKIVKFLEAIGVFYLIYVLSR